MSLVKPETQAYLPQIAEAWAQIKGEHDPIFSACHVDHQSKLIYHAESVLEKGPSDDAFEQAFHKLLNPAVVDTAELPPIEAAPASEGEPEKPVKKTKK